jgi:hypothetical protein
VGVEQFVSSLVASLAWPAAASTMVLILRRPILRILHDRHIQSVEAGPSGVKLSFFDHQIDDAKKELTEDKASPGEASQQLTGDFADIISAGSDFTEEMRQLAKVAPRAVVLESFARLEEILRNTVQVTGQDKSRYRGTISVRNLVRMAVDQELLTPAQMAAFDDIVVVRNILSHEGPGNLDANRALEYADIAMQLIRSISSAAKRNPPRG